jgi:hypothetical protein
MRIIQFLVTLFFCCFICPIASACDCGPLPSLSGSLEQADAVFVGKVLRKEPFHYGQKTTFEIQHSWKFVNRIPASEINIITGSAGDPCYYEFKVNESYLVFAFSRDSSSKNVTDRFVTNKCFNNKKLSEAHSDVAELEKIAGIDTLLSQEASDQESMSWFPFAIIGFISVFLLFFIFRVFLSNKLKR